MVTFRYCGGPFVEPSAWFRRPSAREGLFSDWPQFRGRKVIGTFRGRSAVALACSMLGIKRNDEVLVPAYNCGSEIDPIKSNGARITAFRISKDGKIDMEDLNSRRTSSTRAVYVIHYFGWAEDMRELRSWCTLHGLLLIEDCALALFSGGRNSNIGLNGDAAIYSLSKTFGSRFGGLLSIRDDAICATESLKETSAGILVEELVYSVKESAKRALYAAGANRLVGALAQAKRLANRTEPVDEDFPDMPIDYYFDPSTDLNYSPPQKLLAIAAASPWEAIKARRRSNFELLAEELRHSSNVLPMFGVLPDYVCPLVFPVLVERRDECVKRLQEMGISAVPWWAGFHRGSIDWANYPEAVWLKRNMMTLPIHQDMEPDQIVYIAEAFEKVLADVH